MKLSKTRVTIARATDNLGENERRMRKKELDFDLDPPPDPAIEVDHKADSTRSLRLYARIGVPEVWRHDVRKNLLWFGRLGGQAYVESDHSAAQPRLTPALVLQACDVFNEGEMGENAWLDWLLAWARDLPEAP